MGFILQTSIIFAVVLGVALQLVLKDPIWLAFGIGKTFQPLSEFPYSCRRIEDPRLQACEDMWLSEATRQLFLACSDPLSRQQWMPNANNFNASGRSTRDAVVALDIDSPKGGAFEFRTLSTPGFSGTAGDGLLQLVGLTGIDSPEGDKVELLLVNNRPSVDPVTGEFLDQANVGANSTIEVFETGPQAVGMKHIRTFAGANVSTPNNIAALSSEAFYFTNDKGANKVGLKSLISPLLGQGDISFCSASSGCKRVSERHRYPNGLVRGRDGLIYVPSAMAGGVQVYKVLPEDDGLQKVAEIPVPYSIDNLSVDGKGDIYAAVFPRGIEILQAAKDPLNISPKSAAVRIRKEGEGEGVYVWEKVIEDGAGEVLPGSTVVVHDAKTGRLFFGGVVSPFIAVCEPKY
ncbi:serum paraoxonase arylesterase [Colletotrichum tofieldiae]|uniref:Serum paraoxonase arylesterase n=1 Tax=Colletotrichum tofieldiae TaxID=708197 RepID=A0A166NJE2_9PEZI|nr:serum paraoxonase arylesterase [Colletotrichum tofieldiae]